MFSSIGREEKEIVLNSRKLWSRASCSSKMGTKPFIMVEIMNAIVMGVQLDGF